MSIDHQTSIIGEPPGEHVEFDASGRLVKPLLELPTALVDECRLHADGDGLNAQLVNAVNVAMCQFTVPRSAFGSYSLSGDGVTVGVNVDKLQSHLHNCRSGKRNADDVALQFDRSHTRLTIEREYDATTVARTDQFLNIDPGAIRDEPDLPDLDDGFEYTASVDVRALKDTIAHCDTVGDHVALRPHGTDLLLSSRSVESTDGEQRTTDASEAVFEDVLAEAPDEVDTWTLYSLDYVDDLVNALSKAKIDRVRLRFSDEFPMRLEFERTDSDDELLYEGLYFIAPRIGGEEYP